MANDDLFAPPTREEIKLAQGGLRPSPAVGNDLFAPPSKQELSQWGPNGTAWGRLKGMFTGEGRKELSEKLQEIKNSPEYQKQRADEEEQQFKSARGAVQTSLDALPVIGSVGGGVAGTAAGLLTAPVTGPAGAIAGEYVGAGVGGAAGEGLRYAGEKYLLGKDMTNESLGNRMATGAASGLVSQGFGNVLGAAGKSFAKSGIQEVAPTLGKPGAEQIRAAAQALSVKPTQGMLTGDYVARNLEDSLGQSPSLAGAAIRSEQRPVREAISNSVENAVKDQSLQSDVEAGKKLREGAASYFEGRHEPIQGAYSEIEKKTAGVPLDPKGLKRIANNIRGLDEARFSAFEGHGIANTFAEALEQAQTVNDLKILKSKAGNILRDKNASYEAKAVASQIADKLDQAQKNSLTRQAVKIARETPVFAEGGKAFPSKAAASDAISIAEQEAADGAKGLIGKIKSTNKEYRGLLEDARTFGKGSGLTKANKGMAQTLNDIRSASPEDMATALFDQNNSQFTKFVKDKMPEMFEVARQQRLAQVVKQTGGDPNKILKLTEKMGPEVREMLFGSENVANLGNANTLLQSIPGKVGASDTPRGMSFKDLMNPMQNVNDAARYGLLKGKKALPKAGMLLQKSAPLGQGLMMNGLMYQTPNIEEEQDPRAIRGPAGRRK